MKPPLFTVVALSLVPVILVAVANLLSDAVSVIFRPVALSLRLELGGGTRDFLLALGMSPATSISIIVGSLLLLLGLLWVKSKATRNDPPPPPFPRK
jgi:hypothetical protein